MSGRGLKLGQQINGKPAEGVRHGNYVGHVCRFDDEQFARVRAKALREGTSLSEAIRTLVEWGLEAERTAP